MKHPNQESLLNIATHLYGNAQRAVEKYPRGSDEALMTLRATTVMALCLEIMSKETPKPEDPQ